MEVSKDYLIASIIDYLDSLRISDKTQEKALNQVKKLFKWYFLYQFEEYNLDLFRNLFSGYAYYVSKGNDFFYNISYMNTKIDDYLCFRKIVNKHLDLIITCANILINSSEKNSFLQKYKYVFDELIILTYEEESDIWQFSMKWSNFSSIVGWKKDCGILQATKNNEQNSEVIRFTEKDNIIHFPIEDLILILKN